MTVPSNDPYQTPQSRVKEMSSADFGEVRVFSFSGRIGRMRFLAYSSVMSLMFFAIMLLVGTMAAVASGQGSDAMSMIIGLVVIAMYVLMIVASITFTVRRLNDFDTSGWMSLLMLVPLVNLIFTLVLWFVPGTSGENRYGLQPPPNGIGVMILGLSMPFLMVVGGIVAAIAIPAYQNYVQQAGM